MNTLVKTHLGLFRSDRLLFGYSGAPLGFTCAMEILNEIAENNLAVEGVDINKAGSVDVMDDFAIAGTTIETLAREKEMEHLWDLTGFDAPLSKRSVFNADQPLRWLGSFSNGTVRKKSSPSRRRSSCLT